MSMRNVRLGRISTSVSEGAFDIELHCFDLTINTCVEEGQTVAVFEPLEATCPGIGQDDEEAIRDFVEGFKSIVDHHIEMGTFDQFVNRHFSRQNKRTLVLNPTFERQEDQEIYSSIVQPWQIPHLGSSNAAHAH